MSINWVMVPEDLSRPFVPLPRERQLFASPVRTSFSLKSPKAPKSVAATTGGGEDEADSGDVDITVGSGIAYITTQRVIYLARPPFPPVRTTTTTGTAAAAAAAAAAATEEFKSFAVPLLRLGNTRVTAPFFGPNVLVGEVTPVRDGGIGTPRHPPYTVELRLTFKDGGAYDFHARFCELRERAVQAREIVREIGANASHQEDHGEQLPAYEEDGERVAGSGGRGLGGEGGTGRTTAAAAAAAAGLGAQSSGGQPEISTDAATQNGPAASQPPSFTDAGAATATYRGNSGPTDEPPPDYEEFAPPRT